MNQDKLLQWLSEYEKINAAYATVLSICSFDEETVAPVDGANFRGDMCSLVGGEAFKYMVREDNLKNMEMLAACEDLPEKERACVKQWMRRLDAIRNIPQEEYVAYEMLTSRANACWHKAKVNNDYASFEPLLMELIDANKKRIAYCTQKSTPYETMMDHFEEGLTLEQTEQFFGLVKEKLLPFIREVAKRKDCIDDSDLFGHFSKDQQTKLSEEIQAYLGANKDKLYLGITEHPFTMKISANDSRITTHYDEHALASNIFSVIHEYGHALYGQQVDASLDDCILADNMGMAMHESQSRFLENYIGKRASFWVNLYPRLQELFPSFQSISLETFLKEINASYPSLVRTEADELTYPVHVLIRYEIEKALFDENMDPTTIRDVWNDKYEQYLGVRPDTDTKGILQDSHWAGGAFGYFPTYALGSAYGAQFLQQMEQDMDIDQALSTNHFDRIQEWLKQHIHRYGSMKNASEILLAVTGKSFDANIYIDYLLDKYSKLYHIDL